MHRGFAKLYRKFKEWEWYTDHPTKCLYLHILLSVNHKDGSHQGTPVPKGHMKTGRKKLAQETGLTEQQVRTSLKKLESTGYLNISSTSCFSMVSVVDFDIYNDVSQQNNQQTSQRATNDQPATNQQLTTNKNVKKLKNEKNEKNDTPRPPMVDYWRSDDFEAFHAQYPDSGKQRPRALAEWRKAIDEKRLPVIDKILSSLQHHKNSVRWNEENGKFIPNEATFIEEDRWEVELPQQDSRKPWEREGSFL